MPPSPEAFQVLRQRCEEFLVYPNLVSSTLPCLSTSMSKPIVLVLGAGPGLGQNTATDFSGKGWRVASASRSRKDQFLDNGQLELHIDVTDLESTENAFHRVKAFFGESPSVVVYNGRGD